MDIIVKRQSVPTAGLVKKCIITALTDLGYKPLKGWSEGMIVHPEPVHVTKKTSGIFFWKKIYTYTAWKVACYMELRKTDDSSFTLLITTGINQNTFPDVELFIAALDEQLKDMRESLEIIFVKNNDGYRDIITSDDPDCHHWG